MKLTRLITASAIALLPLAAGASNFVIPAAGTGPGANGSHWQTEVTLHNSTSRDTEVLLTFRDQESFSISFAQRVPARRTLSIPDIVKTVFERETATGAIEVVDTDSDPRNLVVTSRTSNVTANGELGQDIPAIPIVDAARIGSVSTITGPSSATRFRFNFGLYVIGDTTVRWELIRADGTVAATKTVDYRGATQHQHNQGVVSLFSSTPQDNDVIHASVIKGAAVFYGSVIDQQSGDPSFVPGIISKIDPTIRLVGIDRDLNGTIDIADLNGDNVLDSAIDAYTLGFPSFFRIVTAAESGAKVTYEIISSTADARLVDDDGTIQIVAIPGLRGTSGELKVRVTTEAGTSFVLTFPMKFF